LTLDARLKLVWPRTDDEIYFSLLKKVFPSVVKYPRLLLDPEFGPLIFRAPFWPCELHGIILILRERWETGSLWCLVITKNKISRKENEPQWLPGSYFKDLNRLARNELFLECEF